VSPAIVYHVHFWFLLVIVHEGVEIVVPLALPARLGGDLGLPFYGIRVAVVPTIDG
jgi:hypothetical protein